MTELVNITSLVGISYLKCASLIFSIITFNMFVLKGLISLEPTEKEGVLTYMT